MSLDTKRSVSSASSRFMTGRCHVVTGSMKHAIEHGIEPASIIKAIDSDLVKMANLDYFEIPGRPRSATVCAS